MSRAEQGAAMLSLSIWQAGLFFGDALFKRPLLYLSHHSFFKQQLFFNLLDIGTGRAAVLATRSGRRGGAWNLPLPIKWLFGLKKQLSQLESLEF